MDHSENDGTFGAMAYLALSALILFASVSSVWHGWDHNSDGVFTIRDLFQLSGETLSVPYVTLYGYAPDIVRFFEIPVPYEATFLTALAGIVVGLVGAGVGSFVIGGLATWFGRFPAHWRQGRQ
jgi:hypothetical protein